MRGGVFLDNENERVAKLQDVVGKIWISDGLERQCMRKQKTTIFAMIVIPPVPFADHTGAGGSEGRLSVYLFVF